MAGGNTYHYANETEERELIYSIQRIEIKSNLIFCWLPLVNNFQVKVNILDIKHFIRMIYDICNTFC